jgi:two-component system CheB/CheR fusion protein
MAFLNGTLQLLEPSAPRGQRLPIDFFFRSLAQDQRERAICVVLSGNGGDGSLGIRAVKGEGGMAMVQDPESTEYDGMPRSAIATGLVDYVLPAAEMPARLLAYAFRAFGRPPRPGREAEPGAENALNKVFILLRAQTGHDFSQYKASTIHRRIERRMAVHQIEDIEGYVKYLQRSESEAEALFRDLLIGVTSFFRDAEAFKALEEQVVPRLFEGREPRASIRVWSPGCSTGEEAYSLAILLAEGQEAAGLDVKVQVFATDIDSQAIAIARSGLYPSSVAVDISPERLSRFFTTESDGSAYRVNKRIRDMLIFSEQNLIKDPPFSKIDLVSCRNLMIYMGGELQKRVIPLFHYALVPGGILFLGASESVGDFDELFAAMDRKQKLYRRRESYPGARQLPQSRWHSTPPSARAAPRRAAHKAPDRPEPSLRELAERALVEASAPSAALVDGQGDILYLHGGFGSFLELAPGEVGALNALRMARPGLRGELALALRRVAETGEALRRRGLRIEAEGPELDLAVRPVAPRGEAGEGASAPSLYLILVTESAVAPGEAGPPVPATGEEGGEAVAARDRVIEALRQELRAKEDYLQAANEELETANEELKSSNEEMQSVNEELQSTNEELETSKEELQSVNEELSTVNAELQTKLADLSRSNNDMNNLLAGTGIGTVFVDHQLRILRFTPAVTRIINLIPGDVGRPVGHIASNLVGYDRLQEDLRSVLATLIPKEAEVQTLSGSWYTLRLLPYRTLDNVIEGAVITFVDITEARALREALRAPERGEAKP